jgi:hypothetical protein
MLQWKSNKYYIFWMYVCSIRYAARKAHAPSCHPRPLRLHNIFPRYLINDTIFGNELLNIMCFDFLYTASVWIVSHCKKNSKRYIINVGLHRPSCNVHVIPDCNETWIFPTEFQKTSNIIFRKNPSNGSRVVHADGRTDGHDKANSRFSQFCESA